MFKISDSIIVHYIYKNFFGIAFLFIFTFLLFIAADTHAQKPLSVIRDTETEAFLWEITKPILRYNGLDERAVEVIIIDDDSINAFVANGQKIFIHSGLILSCDEVSALIGVIAHEVGHIKGAHISRMDKNLENAGYSTLAGYILGVGTVLAGAPPEAAIALGSAGQNIATRNALAYSREFENSADAVALASLQNMGISPRGLSGLLDKLLQKRKITVDINDEYMLTHPISENRIEFINEFDKNNPIKENKNLSDLEYKFARVKAKIFGFMKQPADSFAKYDNENGKSEITNQMLSAKQNEFIRYYALAAASHKLGKYEEAINYLNKAEKISPNDYYIDELKGQFSYESGRLDEAVVIYKKLTDDDKSSSLIDIKYVMALIKLYDEKLNNISANKDIGTESKDLIGAMPAQITPTKTQVNIPDTTKQYLLEAKNIMRKLYVQNPRNIRATSLLAEIYAKLDDMAQSYLFYSESSLVAGDTTKAKFYLDKALTYIHDNDEPLMTKHDSLKGEIDSLLKTSTQ